MLVARPEDIVLGAAATGALQGQITRRQYLGEKTSYRVALPGGANMDVDCHGPGHDAHATGAIVALTLDPAATLVLAR